MTEVSTAAESGPLAPSPLEAAVGVFIRPRQTFEAMRQRPRYWLPIVVLAVAQVVLSTIVWQSGAVVSDQLAKAEAKGATPEQIDHMRQFFESPVAPIITAAGAPIIFAFILLVLSALAFFTGNLMMGGAITFRHYLSAVSHGVLIRLLDQTIQTAVAWSKGTMDVRLGLGNLLGDDLGPFGHMLDAATDPFALWSAAVVALGIAVYAKKGFGFGVLASLPGFIIGILLTGLR